MPFFAAYAYCYYVSLRYAADAAIDAAFFRRLRHTTDFRYALIIVTPRFTPLPASLPRSPLPLPFAATLTRCYRITPPRLSLIDDTPC